MPDTDNIKDFYQSELANKGYFKDEGEFRTFIKDPKNAKDFYSSEFKDKGYFKDENEFIGFIGGEKKNSIPNSKPTANNSGNGAATQVPTNTGFQSSVKAENLAPLEVQPIGNTPDEIIEPNYTVDFGKIGDVLQAAKDIKKLRNTTKQETVMRGKYESVENVPDQDAIKQAKALEDKLKEQGFDADELISDADNLPNLSANSKQKLQDLYKENPLAYKRYISTIKHQTILNDAVKSIQDDPNLDPEKKQEVAYDFNNLKNIRANIQQGHNLNRDERYYVQRLNESIDKYVPDEEKRLVAKQAIAQEMGQSYGNSITDQDVVNDPRKQQYGLNNYQIAALNYLEDTDKAKFNGMQQVFLDPSQVQGNNDAKIGMQLKRKRLEEIGLNLAANNYKERKLDDKLEEVKADMADLRNKYPEITQLEDANLSQDLSNSQMQSGFDWFQVKLGKAIVSTLGGAKDILVDPFRSDEGRKLRDLELSGGSVYDDVATHLVEGNNVLQHSEIIVKSPEVQQQIDDIKNNDKLSDQAKILATMQVVKDNNDKILVRQKKGGELNLNVASGLYSLSGMVADLLPFMALETVTGGGATAGIGRKLASTFTSVALTSYDDLVAQGVKEDVENPRQWALRNIAVNGLALTAAGGITPNLIRAKAAQSDMLKGIINKMSDKEIETALKNVPSKLENFFNVAKKTVGESFGGHTLKTTAAISGGGVVNELMNGGEIDPVVKAKEFLIEYAKFGLLGIGTKSFGGLPKSDSVERKEAMYEAGKQKDTLIPMIDEKIKNGEMSQAEGEQAKVNIEKMAKIIGNTPAIDAKGKPLSDTDARELMYLKVKEKDLEENIKKDVPLEVKDKLAKQLESVQKDIDKVYKGTLIQDNSETKQYFEIDGKKVTAIEFKDAMESGELKDKQWKVKNSPLVDRAVKEFGGKYDAEEEKAATNESTTPKNTPAKPTEDNSTTVQGGSTEGEPISTGSEQAKPIEQKGTPEEISQPIELSPIDTSAEEHWSKDVKSTKLALESKSDAELETFEQNAGYADVQDLGNVAEQYHRLKNKPENERQPFENKIVKSVEELLGNPKEKQTTSSPIVEERNTDTEKVVTKPTISEEPPLPKGETIVTPNGLTENERQALIENRKKSTTLTEQEVKENNLVELNKKRNSKGVLPTEKRNISSQITQLVRKLNAEAGYEKYRNDGSTVSKSTTIRKGNLTGNRRFKQLTEVNRDANNGSIKEDAVVFTERPKNVRDNYDALLDADVLQHLHILDASGKKTMSKTQIESAISDIENGIPSVGADSLLNTIEQATKDNNLPIIENGHKYPIPLNEVLKVDREVVGEPFDEKNLMNWLNDESHNLSQEHLDILDNELNNIIYEYEQGGIETEIPKSDTGETKIGDTKAEPKVSVEADTKPKTKPTEEGKVEPKVEPAKEDVPPTKPEPKIGKYEKAAREYAAKIDKIELPSWAKIDDTSANKQGGGFDDFKSALSKSMIEMGKLLDNGVEFAKATKEAISHLLEFNPNADKKEVAEWFANHYKENGDYKEPNSTSVKREVYDSERELEGKLVEPKDGRKGNVVFEEVKAKIDSGKITTKQIRDIAKDIASGKNPSTDLDPITQQAALLHDKISLRNESNAYAEDLLKAQKSKDNAEIGRIMDKMAENEALQDDNYKANTHFATMFNKIGLLRQLMVRDDYSLQAMKDKLQKASGNEITPEVQEQLKQLNSQLESANKRLDDLDAKVAEHEATIKQLEEDRAKLIERSETEKADDIAEVVNDTKKLKGAKKEVNAQKKAENKAIRTDLLAQLKAIAKKNTGNLNAGPGDFFEKLPEYTPILRDIIKTYISDGMITVSEITDALEQQLKEIPEFAKATRRDIYDMVSKYGVQVKPSKNEIDIAARDITSQMLLLAKIERAKNAEQIAKTGYQRDKASQEVRDLQKQLNFYMDKMGVEALSDDQIKGQLDAVKSRLKNQIDDLNKYIETGEEPLKKTSGVVYDEEANALKAERDRLKEIVEEIEKNNGVSWRKKVDRVNRLLDKQIADVESEIASGKKNVKAQSEKIETPNIDAKREKLAELRKLRDEMMPKSEEQVNEERNKAYRTRLENMQDKLEKALIMNDADFNKFLESRKRKKLELDNESLALKTAYEVVKTQFDNKVSKAKFDNMSAYYKALYHIQSTTRNILVSSPAIFVKIGAAIGYRAATTLPKEVIGYGLSKVPFIANAANKSMAEGITTRKDLANFLSTYYKDLFSKESWKLLKNVKNGGQYYELSDPKSKHADDIHLTKAGKALSTYVKFHGALKDIPAKAMFNATKELVTSNMIRNGATMEEINNPITQEAINQMARQRAYREKFAQKNNLVDIQKGAEQYFERKGMFTRAFALKSSLPIVKIGTNLTAEALRATPGTGLLFSGKDMLSKYGTDKAEVEKQSSNIQRTLKEQGLGAAAFMLGFYLFKNNTAPYYTSKAKKDNDEKEKPIEEGVVAGIPKTFVHSAIMDVVKEGATAAQYWDMLDRKDKAAGVDTKGWLKKAERMLFTTSASTSDLMQETSQFQFAKDVTELMQGKKDGWKYLVDKGMGYIPGSTMLKEHAMGETPLLYRLGIHSKDGEKAFLEKNGFNSLYDADIKFKGAAETFKSYFKGSREAMIKEKAQENLTPAKKTHEQKVEAKLHRKESELKTKHKKGLFKQLANRK